MMYAKCMAMSLTLAGVLLMGGINPMSAAQDSPQVQKAAPDWDTIKKEADAEKAVMEAQKAASDAQKAQAEAELAAFKAKVGEVPSSGYTGSVDVKEKAGSTEAALLAAKAVTEAAKTVADAISKSASEAAAKTEQKAKKTVFLYASGDAPNFQTLIAFRGQTALVKKAFANAKAASKSADETAPEPTGFRSEALPIVGAAGVVLEAVNKLLGFFRTDYTVGGIELSLDDSLLVHALAGAIVEKGTLDVKLPATYNAGALSDAGVGILADLTALASERTEGQEKANRHDKLSARFTDDAGKEHDAARKTDLLNKAKAHKNASDEWKTAFTLYDSFFSKLTTADDKGVVPITNVIRDGVVADALAKDDFLLVVKLQKSGGAYYTKKNMWTLFGGMPFYHMGGVVVSYVLLKGQQGLVATSGVVPVHAGFVKAGALQGYLK